ncbi:MAG: hypothetical protein HYY40_14560 [Bacteroidetes bacterium]|nr:hypothetical protein [Bacteroidota bacterium]
MKTFLFVFSSLFFLYSNTWSQSPTDVFKRKLAVELLDEDPKKIEKLKKENNPDAIERYKCKIERYNTLLKWAIEKYWKLNKVIEFKTESEIKKIRKASDKKYVCLKFAELRDPNSGLISIPVPGLEYGKPEKMIPEYQIAIAYGMARKNHCFNESDFAFTIQLLQRILEKSIKQNKFAPSLMKWGPDEGGKNCSKIKNRTLLIDREFMAKDITDDDVSKEFPYKFKITNSEELNTAYISGDSSVAVPFLIPYPSGVAYGYYRVLADPVTGNIMKFTMGLLNDEKIRKMELNSFGNCNPSKDDGKNEKDTKGKKSKK